MSVLHAAQELESIRIVVLLFVVFVVAFWKLIVQILIVIAAAMVLMGAVTLFGALHII